MKRSAFFTFLGCGFVLVFVSSTPEGVYATSTYGVPSPSRALYAPTNKHRSMQSDGESGVNTSGIAVDPTARMSNNGGPVLTDIEVQPLFWGPNWGHATFRGDIVTGIASLYAGLAGSDYMLSSSEYAGDNGNSTSTFIVHQPVIDTSTASVDSQAVVNKICSTFGSAIYFPVYTDIPRPQGASACAWHSFGTCFTGNIQYTIEFGVFYSRLDEDVTEPNGQVTTCWDSGAVPGQSQALSAVAQASAHELSETRTDPLLNAWYAPYTDANGLPQKGEDGDLCNRVFGPFLVTLSNGTSWKLQGEWSNAAVASQTGFGQARGCVDTGTPSNAMALFALLSTF